MKSKITILFFLFASFTQAQWVKTNGPEGVSVTSFLDVNDSVLLCGTKSKGVSLSSDHGNTWSQTAGMDNLWIECLAMDSLYVYAGSFGNGVYRSADQGHTWVPANAAIQATAITCLLVADGYLFAASVNDGFFRSPDHGATWTDVSQNLLYQSFMPAMTYSGNRLVVEVDNYIYYSFDDGDTWNIDQGVTQFYTVHDFFTHGDTVLATSFNCMFRSTDAGNTWSGPAIITSNYVGFDNDADTVYAGTFDGVFRSTDYGASWSFTPSADLRHGARDQADFKISGPNFLFAYQEIGVYKSANKGLNWSQVPLGNFPVGSTLDDAMIFDRGALYAGTHSNGVYKSTNQGSAWTKIGTTNSLDTLSNEVIFDLLHAGDSLLFAGGCGNGLFRSADNGATWTRITSGLPPDNGTFTCVKTLAQSGPNILCAMTNGVFYSVDSGLTFLPTNLIPADVLQCGGFAVHGNIVCVGVIGNPPFPTGIYRSTNYGVSWTFASGLLDIETMAAGGGQTMYAGELFSGWMSPDDGFTWYGLPVPAAFSILAWDQYCFIGANDGVYFSDDYGFNWIQVNQGLLPSPNNSVQGLTRDSQFVYAGTYGEGVWRRPLTDFGIPVAVQKPVEQPSRLFPNPARDHFMLAFKSYPDPGTEISLVNTTGEIVQSKIYSGERVITFSVGNLPDGTYLLQYFDKGHPFSEKIIVRK